MREENFKIAFVIMQIGNIELDKIYADVFMPAIKAANLIPKRIDQDNEGQLLKREIVEYIENADIIIADLTNERPNCYLEIGYTMGLDKYKNLIFTAREDHHPDNPNYKNDGPKIHFDLSGYDILFWNPKYLDEFRSKLIDRISRRLAIINPIDSIKIKSLWDNSWLELQRKHVQEQIKKAGNSRVLEILISPSHPTLSISQSELLDIADNSQINTFGWPIGIVFKNTPGFKPIPKSDGILSEVVDTSTRSFDYSYFKKNGQIYITKSIFEDASYPNSILPDVRIQRTTELLMYIARFYTRCGFPNQGQINIVVKYTGLSNNYLRYHYMQLPLSHQRISNENESITELTTTISEIESKLPELVNALLKDLFILFDFYKVEFGYLNSVVNKFVMETNRNFN